MSIVCTRPFSTRPFFISSFVFCGDKPNEEGGEQGDRSGVNRGANNIKSMQYNATMSRRHSNHLEIRHTDGFFSLFLSALI